MSMYRDRKVTVKFSADEYALIQRAALCDKTWGKATVSRFVRKVVNNAAQELVAKEEMMNVLRSQRRIIRDRDLSDSSPARSPTCGEIRGKRGGPRAKAR